MEVWHVCFLTVLGRDAMSGLSPQYAGLVPCAWTANQPLAGVQDVFRCDDFEALREAALTGFGIALLPSWVVGRDIAAGSLRRLLATAVDAGGETGGIYVLRALAEPPAKVTAFIASLRTVVGSPPIWDRVNDKAKSS
jgi:DNA-binding transcriptional LysR family regulator